MALVFLNHAGLVPWGFAGVDILFVLSGFLITNVLYEEWESSGRISFTEFYRRRARRLLPALIMMVIATAILMRHGAGAGSLPIPVELGSALLFVGSWPLALYWLLRRRTRIRVVVAILLAAVVLLALFTPWLIGFEWAQHGYYNPFPRAAEPLVGCLAAVLWRSGKLPRQLRWSPVAWLAIIAIAALGSQSGVPGSFRYLVLAVLAGVLIGHLVDSERTTFAAILTLRPVRYLGKISYGLYLYQQPVDYLVDRVYPDGHSYAHTGLAAVITVVVATLSWYLVESVFLWAAHHTATGETATAPAPSAPTELASERHRREVPGTDCETRSLPPEHSAEYLLSRGQQVTFVAVLAGLLIMLLARPWTVGQGIVLAAVALNTIHVTFQSILVLAAYRRRGIQVSAEELHAVPDHDLPRYSVLVPLYQEAAVLATLIAKLSELDYPVDKLQIILLIEEDDRSTRAALRQIPLGTQFEVAIFVPSMPRTKPKACNLGLRRVTGELCTIYDAEDRPEPDQLRKMVAAFRRMPDKVICIQAELRFWNPYTNWLAGSFAAEYALRYGLWTHGLDYFRFPIPLGGTSNHFRTTMLRELGAWDPYNVTEDADLGIRIARCGLESRSLVTATAEEANGSLGNWLRQRSRWEKGHMQTWLVHMRSPRKLWRELGFRRFLAFQLTLGYPFAVDLANPFLWSLSVAWLVTGASSLQKLFVPDLATAMLAIGGFAFLTSTAQLVVACWITGQPRVAVAAFTAPLYGILKSVAAYKGLFQLIRPSKRHYWELTRHGLVTENP